MRKRPSWMIGCFTAVGVFAFTGSALASSHREAPAIADDPAADNTDTYAWVQGNNLVVVANYIGLELPEGGPNWAKFSDDVLYEIHIAHGGTSLDDALTYQFQFRTARPTYLAPGGNPLPGPAAGQGQEFFAQLTGSGAFNQTYTVTQLTNGGSPVVLASNVAVPPPNVGPETNTVVYQIPSGTSYEANWVDSGKSTGTLANGGGSVFAGPRDDPFFVDLGAIFDLAQLRPVANPTEAARDSIAYMNVHAIVLQIPLTVANLGTAPTGGAGNAAQTVGVWASASRKKVNILRRGAAGGGWSDTHLGPWVQVSRLGLPLINEAVIGLQDKDYWNRLTPKDDLNTFGAYFLNPVVVRDAEAIGFYGMGAPLAACASGSAGSGNGPTSNRTDVINVINMGNAGITSVGDVLRVDLGNPSSTFPNGRLLTDKVVDLELGLLLCTSSHITALVGACGPTTNEPEAPLPKSSGGNPVFPYLEPPWEGRSANPRPVPSLP
jgi:hypothetical protein